MKFQTLALAFSTVLLVSCGGGDSTDSSTEGDDTSSTNQTTEELSISEKFGENPQSLLDLEGNPVQQLIDDAKKNADQKLTFYVANADKALEVASGYEYAIVITGNHTVVRILSYDDTEMSGSWGIPMPLVEGYIRRGGRMEPVADYMNNIVGMPDDQDRKIYLFNRKR